MDSSVDLSSEAAVSWTEWGIVVLLLVLAVFYLWRKLFVKKGCACAGCGKAGSCSKNMTNSHQYVKK